MDVPTPSTIVTAFATLQFINVPKTKRDWFIIRRSQIIEPLWLAEIRKCIRDKKHEEFHSLYAAAFAIFKWCEDSYYSEQLQLLFLSHYALTYPGDVWDYYDREFFIRHVKKKDVHKWAKSQIIK